MSIPIEIIVVAIDKIKMTFIIKRASVKAFKTLDTDESENIRETVEHKFKNSLQKATSNMDGKNTSATAIIPTTPTLLRISDE